MTKDSNFKRKLVEGSNKQSREIECFKCGGKGHFASMCPTENLNLLEGEVDQQEDEK